jgi:micrococcal nuclease
MEHQSSRFSKILVSLAAAVIALVLGLLSQSSLPAIVSDVGGNALERTLGANVTNAAYTVVHVSDGDTLTVADADGNRTSIRVIGINTPETVAPGQGVQCFGPEASAAAKELLLGNRVAVSIDPTQDRLDRYGRTLAYIALPDGSDFGATMIDRGLAHEYTYRKAYERQATYRALEKTAASSGTGLWSACPR